MRTTREFRPGEDVWPIIDDWAGSFGYALRKSSDGKRLYQRGDIKWSSPTMVEVTQREGVVCLEAWLQRDRFSRVYVMIATLFIIRLPLEMALESGGWMAVGVRKKARTQLNDLLQRLGQPSVS